MNKVEKRPVKSILKPGFWVFGGIPTKKPSRKEVMHEMGKMRQEIDMLEWVLNNEVLCKDQKKPDRITPSPV